MFMGMQYFIPQVILALVVAATFVGCDIESGEPLATEDAIDGLGDLDLGSADGFGFPVTELALGESLEDQWVDALAAGADASREELERGLKVYRFHVEAGQPFAAIMRRTSGRFDPYLILKDPNGDTVATRRDQGILPMADEIDVVLTYTPTTSGAFILFASDIVLQSAGSFSLDLLPLPDLPVGVDLGRATPGMFVLTDALREDQQRLDEFEAAGAIIERSDGLLSSSDGIPDGLDLRSWAASRNLVSSINNTRFRLFEYCAGENVDAAAVGRSCAALWASQY